MATGHLDLLDGLDVHDGLHRILGGVGEIGILLGLVRRKLGSHLGPA